MCSGRKATGCSRSASSAAIIKTVDCSFVLDVKSFG